MEIRQATIRTMEPVNTDWVTFNFCGENIRKHIKPIKEACSKCAFWKGKFASRKKCQTSQKKDAEMRGFVKLVCPHQFID